MPVLESTDHAIQRSVLRHRPIVSDTDRQGKTGITPVAQRASRLRSPETEEDEESTSGRIPATTHPKQPRMIPTGTKQRGIRRVHPLLSLGIGMIVMLALWTLLTLAVSWWNMTWNDMHYGRPRTFQIDVVVGQNDSAANPSHFIALNFKGRIEVIEFPGGDASKARIYLAPQPYVPANHLIPAPLTFLYV